MVTVTEGQAKADELGCTSFHDISVRESIEEVRTWLPRSGSALQQSDLSAEIETTNFRPYELKKFCVILHRSGMFLWNSSENGRNL